MGFGNMCMFKPSKRVYIKNSLPSITPLAIETSTMLCKPGILNNRSLYGYSIPHRPLSFLNTMQTQSTNPTCKTLLPPIK